MSDRYPEFRGANAEAFRAREPEVLLSGPAGTGKTMAWLFKLFIAAEKHPGMRGLIARKTRESLSEAALVTWEQKVLPEGHPALAGPQRKLRTAYRFPNGSEIIVGGMDKASKLMSTEFDLIYVQEAIELAENDWESLTTRLRNGKMPYSQLVGDTNPDHPRHWLKVRCDRKQTRILHSRHEDNPALWDAQAKAWTPMAHRPDGSGYIDKLDALTGPRKPRLRYGQWQQAEGVVYPEWDPATHLVDRFPIPAAWGRYLSIDFGYKNPFVCQWWAEDPDGRLFRYREIYMSGRLVEDHARQIAALSKEEPRPRLVICDHDAEDRATLERHLAWSTVPAAKEISPGLQEVQSRLKASRDGKPRMFFLRDSLVELDRQLDDAKLPVSSEAEFDSYVWDTRTGRKKGELPMDRDNHGMDCVRYMAYTLESQPRGRPEGITSGGDSVWDDAPAGVFGLV